MHVPHMRPPCLLSMLVYIVLTSPQTVCIGCLNNTHKYTYTYKYNGISLIRPKQTGVNSGSASVARPSLNGK